jgi:hypothetical protein
MAALPGEDYSETNLGCIYLVPVHTHITTQDGFKKVHVSRHNMKKALIDGGDYAYKKGKHQNPHLRKEQDTSLRKPSKEQDTSLRKPSKSQDLSVRKKENMTGWARRNTVQSDTEIQKDFQLRFETLGGVGTVSHEAATLKCRTITKFYSKHIIVGLRCVSMKKRKRWEATPAGKRAASAVFDEQPYKRLRPCG